MEWTFSVPELPAREDDLLYGREDAKENVIQYLNGCRDRTSGYYDKKSKKFSMLGTSGVKGIGETELQAQICTKWAKEALGENTKALYVSYSGGGKAGAYCQQFKHMASPMASSTRLGISSWCPVAWRKVLQKNSTYAMPLTTFAEK